MSKTTTKTQAAETVEITCPRCGGTGRRPLAWKPDGGICYRCKGRCTVVINIARHKAALRHLRAKFVEQREELRNAVDADTAEFLAECLNRTVESGLRVRSDLELAGVEVD